MPKTIRGTTTRPVEDTSSSAGASKESHNTTVKTVNTKTVNTTNNTTKTVSSDPIETNTSKPIPIIIPSDKRKLRIGTAKSMSGKVLAPSGKFRKSSDGYFKKKLKSQSSSEFSA
jgi:hypothetical protein